MTPIFDIMVQFFEEGSWKYSKVKDSPVLSLSFSGKNGTWQCFSQAREQQDQAVFYSICPVKAAEDKRPSISEFVTRANYGLVIGNFELDFSDGEIRYKTSLDVEGDRLTTALMKPLVHTNLLMMDRYLPGIMAVLFAGVTPIAAIQQIEGKK